MAMHLRGNNGLYIIGSAAGHGGKQLSLEMAQVLFLNSRIAASAMTSAVQDGSAAFGAIFFMINSAAGPVSGVAYGANGLR